MNMEMVAVKMVEAQQLIEKAESILKEVDGEAAARLAFKDPCTPEGQSFERFARSVSVSVSHLSQARIRLPGREWCRCLEKEEKTEPQMNTDKGDGRQIWEGESWVSRAIRRLGAA